MSTHATNADAQLFKSLHVPGKPLFLANVYDIPSAKAVASLPNCKALATASFAVALANGTDDSNLDLDTQIATVQSIARVAQGAGKPLSVDLQDGYGDRLEEAVKKMISIGVVGINLEDSDDKTTSVMDDDVAVGRIKRALAAAKEAGVPDFVVNARSDSWLRGGSLQESIRKGKLYLEAGATTVFVLGGGPNGASSEQVKQMVDALDGKVNIGMRLSSAPGAVKTLTSEDLTSLGVARVSVGPQMLLAAVEAIKKAAATVLGSA
jgi:2-methylisocitrate lyase-like PEP mutase family enzyme